MVCSVRCRWGFWSRALRDDVAGFFHLSDPLSGCGRAQIDEIKHPREVVGEISSEDRFVVGDTVPQFPDGLQVVADLLAKRFGGVLGGIGK